MFFFRVGWCCGLWLYNYTCFFPCFAGIHPLLRLPCSIAPAPYQLAPVAPCFPCPSNQQPPVPSVSSTRWNQPHAHPQGPHPMIPSYQGHQPMEMAYHQISSTPQVHHPLSNALVSSPVAAVSEPTSSMSWSVSRTERHHTRWSAQAETKQSGLGDVGNCCQVLGGNEKKHTYKNLGQFDVYN